MDSSDVKYAGVNPVQRSENMQASWVMTGNNLESSPLMFLFKTDFLAYFPKTSFLERQQNWKDSVTKSGAVPGAERRGRGVIHGQCNPRREKTFTWRMQKKQLGWATQMDRKTSRHSSSITISVTLWVSEWDDLLVSRLSWREPIKWLALLEKFLC